MSTDMTFDDWADSRDLGAAEREVCWALLVYIRRRQYAEWMIKWAEGGDDAS